MPTGPGSGKCGNNTIKALLMMMTVIVMVMRMMEELMITSTITISLWDHNRYPFETKKLWDDGFVLS